MISKRGVGAHCGHGALCASRHPASLPRRSALTAVPVISIIDDDESIRAGLSNLVRSLGYIVYVFSSADAFLHSPQLLNSWCVIADVRMPDMSGVQLQTHLRSEGNRVPFIFITAVPEETTREQAVKDGAICFLTKPLEEDALIDCLNTAVERHVNRKKS
jgi:FixJ family two-component response regulator